MRLRHAILPIAVIAAAGIGCTQRTVVPSANLMRGDVVENVYVQTVDGYEYTFRKGVVRGDQFVGTLVEEVEVVGENDEIYVTNEVRDVELPISSVLKVEALARSVGTNTLYVAGAVGAGAIIFAALADDDQSTSQMRGTGVAVK